MTAQQERAIARVCAHECLMGELVEIVERYQLISEWREKTDTHLYKDAAAVLAKARGEAA